MTIARALGGRRRRATAGLAYCTLQLAASCAPDPSANEQVMTVSISPISLQAGGDECANVTVKFTKKPASGQSVILTTTIGVLSPDAATEPAKRMQTLTTTSSKQVTTSLCPGVAIGTGRIVASASGLDSATSNDVTVQRAPLDRVFVSASAVELHAPTQTTSTLRVDLIPSIPNADLTGTRVGLTSCCNLTATVAGGSADAACGSLVNMPPFVDFSAPSPHTATAALALTVDGLAFTRATAEVKERDVRIYAYFPADASRSCAALGSWPSGEGGAGGATTDERRVSQVVLRLTTRDPAAEPALDTGGTGMGGTATAGAGGS